MDALNGGAFQLLIQCEGAADLLCQGSGITGDIVQRVLKERATVAEFDNKTTLRIPTGGDGGAVLIDGYGLGCDIHTQNTDTT